MDGSTSDEGDVFAIPDLWCPSNLLTDDTGLSSYLFSQLKLDDIDAQLPELVQEASRDDIFFSIPNFNLEPSSKSPGLNQQPDAHEDAPEPPKQAEEDEDIWLFPEENPTRQASYQSWDAFKNQKIEGYQTAYLTEAGAALFDTVLASNEDNLRIGNSDHVVLDSRAYAASLLALGLGRSSVLFLWDDNKKAFKPALSKMRISGFTGNSLDALLVMFLECGKMTKFLQRFVDKTYSKHASSGRIALADAVGTLLSTIQSLLSTPTTSSTTLLQLQSRFRPAHAILSCFQRIVVNGAETRSDESMLSTIFEEIQLLEHRTDNLRDILLEILSRVSRPWLEFTGEWLGLQREAGIPITKEGEGKSFVKVENRAWIDEQGLEDSGPDYVLDYDRVPSFIAPEDARAIFEVGRSLRILKTHHTDHPLARADVVESAKPPTLEWKFAWQDIVEVEAKALKYEKDLASAIHEFSTGASSKTPEFPVSRIQKVDMFNLDFFGRPEEEMQAHVLASIDVFNQPFGKGASSDSLVLGLATYLSANPMVVVEDESVFAPPVSLSPIFSFNPIISAQARMVNRTCMRMFFKSHKLRDHLSVQREFQLLGNGVFSSRLSHALFDPELESAERHKDVARSGGMMGLRLGGRDNWPPASSELRLALMGVLTESYISKDSSQVPHTATFLDHDSLPGDLSFAVRDMSDEEIEACMNPDSIEALDFLRLSYKPPAPLEAVITPVILFKYDQLFKLLLRVLRMLYVVTALFREASGRAMYWQGVDHIAQRFRIEAQHFVSSICGYFFDTGIEMTWRIFERKLDEVEERIDFDDDDHALGQNEGLDKLRDYHERVLDRIMFILLLRKRQQPVMKLLEEIFTLVLQFSKISKERVSNKTKEEEIEADEKVKEIYLKFRKKVGVFIIVCRGMSEKKGYGDKTNLDRTSRDGALFDGDDLVEESTISQLLSRLEMSDYYSRPVRI